MGEYRSGEEQYISQTGYDGNDPDLRHLDGESGRWAVAIRSVSTRRWFMRIAAVERRQVRSISSQHRPASPGNKTEDEIDDADAQEHLTCPKIADQTR